MQYFNVKQVRREYKVDSSALSEPYAQFSVGCVFQKKDIALSVYNITSLANMFLFNTNVT